MTARTASRLAWGLWALTPAALAAGVIIGLVTDTFRADGPFIVLVPAFLMAFATVGALVASRRPENPIGWILLATSVAWGLITIADSYAIYAMLSGNTDSTLARVSDWVNFWFYGASIFLPVTLLLLLFPDGRLPSPRWRPFLWLGVIGNAGITVAMAFAPSETTGDTHFLEENPFGIEALEPVLEVVAAVSWALGAVALLAAVVAIVVRFRRSTGDERQQMKLVAYAGVVVVLALVIQAVVGAASDWTFGPVADVVLPAVILTSLTLIPLAAGIAILRYRLYEIDLVIRRTLVFGALAGFISLAYVTVVVLIGTRATDSLVPSLVATAVVAVLFQPIRRRVTKLANRLVFGVRAEPYEILARFSERVGAAFAATDVLPRTARVIAEGTGAARVEISLGAGGERHLAASWPRDAAANGAPPVSREIRHRDEALGQIRVWPVPGQPLRPAEEKLVDDLASQTGLVVKNAALTEELRTKVDQLSDRARELQESRMRIVHAHDAERRRLERNIHDGAQQHLVALAVKLRLASATVAKDPAKAAEALRELGDETRVALDTLLDLASGIYPARLEEQGIGPALALHARTSGAPVAIDADGIGRLPIEVEAAVYFVCLEAIQNAAKHARASSVRVRLGRDHDSVTFAVEDDGVGFETTEGALGSGLQNMRDRLAAIGGSLDIRSTPGKGTRVVGRILIPEGVRT